MKKNNKIVSCNWCKLLTYKDNAQEVIYISTIGRKVSYFCSKDKRFYDISVINNLDIRKYFKKQQYMDFEYFEEVNITKEED